MHGADTGLLIFTVTSSLLVWGFSNGAVHRMRTPADFLEANGVEFQNFISHATLWHIYIDAFVYHMLEESSVSNATTTGSHVSLTNSILNLFTLTIGKQNPCIHMSSLIGNYSDNDWYRRVKNILAFRIEHLLTNWSTQVHRLQSNLKSVAASGQTS